MKEIQTARAIFYVMAASFLFSFALLGYFRLTGKSVPAWVLAGWGGLGVAGLAVTPALSPDRRWVAWVLVAMLGPWLTFSLVNDVRQKIYAIAVSDVAGLVAVGFGAYLTYKPAAG